MRLLIVVEVVMMLRRRKFLHQSKMVRVKNILLIVVCRERSHRINFVRFITQRPRHLFLKRRLFFHPFECAFGGRGTDCGNISMLFQSCGTDESCPLDDSDCSEWYMEYTRHTAIVRIFILVGLFFYVGQDE